MLEIKITIFALVAAIIITVRNVMIEQLETKEKYNIESGFSYVKNLRRNIKELKQKKEAKRTDTGNKKKKR